MTFSIVAWDPSPPSGPQWGGAVASKFLAVGGIVLWGRAGAGVVATQAMANVGYGPAGLELMARGSGASEVVAVLTGDDDQRDHRQLGVVDARGHAANFTGSECYEWAGGRSGEGFSCQGNILAGSRVVDAMAEAFGSATGPLADRLVAALAAGEGAGGDRRGKESAALLVVAEGAGYGGGNDRAVDLRVDDHSEPVAELRRLLALNHLYFPSPEELDFVPIDEAVGAELRRLLAAAGYEPGGGSGYDDALRRALFDYVGTENLEQRWSERAEIDRSVLEHLRRTGQSESQSRP